MGTYLILIENYVLIYGNAILKGSECHHSSTYINKFKNGNLIFYKIIFFVSLPSSRPPFYNFPPKPSNLWYFNHLSANHSRWFESMVSRSVLPTRKFPLICVSAIVNWIRHHLNCVCCPWSFTFLILLKLCLIYSF